MKTYTMQEACNALAIDSATLFRWMKRAGMEVSTDEQDKRRRVLTHSQLATLATLHHRVLLTQNTVKAESSDKRIAQLEQRLTALEGHVQAIQSTLERLTLATSYHDASPNEKPPRNVSQRVSTLPDGWIDLPTMLKQYPRAKRSTVIRNLKEHIKKGHWILDSHEVKNALDEAGQAEFLRLFGQ